MMRSTLPDNHVTLWLQEAGYNALHFNQLAHSWVKNVKFTNTDSAFYCRE